MSDARTVRPGHAVAYHDRPTWTRPTLTRHERKALQSALHVERAAGRMTEARCAELCAMLELLEH